MAVKVLQTLVGVMDVFCYIVWDPETKEAVIIDPAGDFDKLSEIIKEKGLSVKYIINTHAHSDHNAENLRLKELTGAPIVIHKLEDSFSKDPLCIEWNKKMGFDPPAPADILIEDGSELKLKNFTVKFIHTPGHTPGSCCILIENNLFTGDTLFVGDVGRTDLHGSSFNELIASLRKLIKTLDPETIVWPGHNYGDTPFSTIKAETESNPYITDFVLDG